jgi:hypothetical protein
MKHYLLTWYGMTDLRASLELEDTDGPVLSALRTGEYSDAVILAYTDPAKDPHALAGRFQDEWRQWVSVPPPARPALSREHVHRVVDALSNTASGHEVFSVWLRGSLDALGVKVSIQFIPSELKKLNDARGVHAAATEAVRAALRDPDEKRVTTYVSPGTPVMAYTWALIARSNPQLMIGVISSSDPRKPPEQIELPKELLSAAIHAPNVRGANAGDYDLVIHLLGEQTIPVFFGMRQFSAKEHLLLTTKVYEAQAHRLAKATATRLAPVVVADPFRPADTRKAITRQVAELAPGAKVAVNMTGGTKLMFAGALSACWELGLDPFYVEIRNHNIIFLRDGTQVPFVGISDVEDFLRAGDFNIVSPGRWPHDPTAAENQRLSETQKIWAKRDALRDLYRSKPFQDLLYRWDKSKSTDRHNWTFSFSWAQGKASIDREGPPQLVLHGETIAVPRRGFFPFLAGAWLEEYVFSLLRPLESEGVVRDIRVGLEIGYRKSERARQAAQEFDVSFTDGKRLWVVECKAGNVKQDAIQKLANNIKVYGGNAARGLLISSFSLIDEHKSRLVTLRSWPSIPTNCPRRRSGTSSWVPPPKSRCRSRSRCSHDGAFRASA